MSTVERIRAALADRYRIERELGAGGMATVYLAQDLKHDRQVAIKVLKPELAAVLGAERFLQEIKTTAQLQHPHILALFDSGQADGFLYYVMPYIEGETLRKKLDREKQLGVEEAVKTTTEVADALDYAHRHGVIHRDIKPENILLHDGRPIVADFGIALAVSAAAGGRMTESGLSLGTPHYMSPEQATADRDITARSDIYSLASVLYEMLTGEPPHMGNSAQQIIMKIIADPARPVTELRRNVPPNVAAALAQALEKLPADRFDSAKAFAEALGNPGFHTTAVNVTGRLAAPPPYRLTALLAATVVLLAAALIWSWRSRAGLPAGPTTYDVALPDSAPLAVLGEQAFAVSPAGDFVVYISGEGLHSLWYRSLRDASARRIEGTDGAVRVAISPDGTKVAFARASANTTRWTIDVVPVAGGPTATLGTVTVFADLQWLDDGRVQAVDGDGTHARWFDPGGGPSEERDIRYCILPAYLSGRDQFLCGGGGNRFANLRSIRDTATQDHPFWTGGADSARAYGSDFHVVDSRYAVYMSLGGDLLAATLDLARSRVGRSVRLVTGIEHSAYWGAGTFGLSRSGALVYALGPNYGVGNVVTTDGHTFDTLNVGRDAFRLFAMSPNGRRLAAFVGGLDGEELRVYNLTTGEHVTLVRSPFYSQPVWSPGGDRIMFSAADTLFVADPDGSIGPERLAVAPTEVDPYTWSDDSLVTVGGWNPRQALALDLTRRPVKWDTLASDAVFPVRSPDGRWLAYNNVGLTNVWLIPFPPNGKRYLLAPGREPVWLSSHEVVIHNDEGIIRAIIDAGRDPPVVTKRLWIDPPDFVETAGLSHQVTPDGRLIYVRTEPAVPGRYLRVVPNWVAQMKRAVDDANR